MKALMSFGPAPIFAPTLLPGGAPLVPHPFFPRTVAVLDAPAESVCRNVSLKFFLRIPPAEGSFYPRARTTSIIIFFPPVSVSFVLLPVFGVPEVLDQPNSRFFRGRLPIQR